jgi:hypothetical protein
MLQAVAQYEMDHIGVSFLPNPLWDEGFRVKRYDPADSSSETVRLPARFGLFVRQLSALFGLIVRLLALCWAMFRDTVLHDSRFGLIFGVVTRQNEMGGLHHWHVDSGGDSCRELAVLVYLSDVPSPVNVSSSNGSTPL